MNLRQNTWLFSTPSTGSREDLHLFCFPFAGGGASVFREWGRRLGTGFRVHAVQYPGHEDRLVEPLLNDIDLLTSSFLAAHSEDFEERNFALFGHSLGAKIAFETACRLEDRGLPPQVLFVSASRSPQRPELRRLHDLPEAQFKSELRNLQGTPEIILQSDEFMEMYLPILRADFAMDENFFSNRVLKTVPIDAFYGAEDTEVNRSDLEEWSSCTARTFRLEMVQGDHFFLKTQTDSLLTSIRERLQRTDPEETR